VRGASQHEDGNQGVEVKPIRHLLCTAALLCIALPTRADEFRNTEDAAVVRGSIVFKTFCLLCHGEGGEGDGRAAKIHNPKPANLTASFLTDQQKEIIIRNGGASVGRSPVMPAWGQHLTEEQIKDVVAYLRKITKSP
jgi:mono/diheme cytochrome c family protein